MTDAPPNRRPRPSGKKRVDARVTGAAALQQNLAQVIRHARLPQVHRRIMADSKVFLDPSAYATLFSIDVLDDPSLSELASEMLLDLSTVSRQVRRLADAGLVERQPNPNDQRITIVNTTPEGHEITERITVAWQEAFAEALPDWNAEELHSMADGLGRLAASLRAFAES